MFLMTKGQTPPSLVNTKCPHCGNTQVESGGNRKRKLRTLEGTQTCHVKRWRCRGCKRQLGSTYPKDCPRSSWYSLKLQSVFMATQNYRVTEAVHQDLAVILEYSITQRTRLAWSGKAAMRAARRTDKENSSLAQRIAFGSIDDLRFGKHSRFTAYIYWEAQTGCPLAGDFEASREFTRVRDLLSSFKADVVLCDGGKEILEALNWLEVRPVVYRCWFHVLQSILVQTKKADRKAMLNDFKQLLGYKVLGEAEAFLWDVMFKRWTSVIQLLIGAWEGIKAWWSTRDFATNNVAERGNGRLWRRVHRRNIRSVGCGQDWLELGLYRVRHRKLRRKGKSVWRLLSSHDSPDSWISAVSTPLGRSTDF